MPKVLVDIPDTQYNNIMSVSSVNLGRIPYKGIVMYAINGIKHGTVLPDNDIDIQPVIHANWLSGDCKGAHCSNCEEYTAFIYGNYDYCPHCGAKMDKE